MYYNVIESFTNRFKYKQKECTECTSGNSGYNAFMNAISKISEKSDLFITQLIDFEVTIPKGGHTNALFETVIIWQDGVRKSGVLEDQVMASIKATEKTINYFLTENNFTLIGLLVLSIL